MKKGFTLIELLAVIAILAIVLLIAVPYVINTINNVKNNAFVKDEQMMISATKTYLAANLTLVPANIGDTIEVKLSDLQTNNLITIIKDPKNNSNTCNGYVIVTKLDNTTYDYTPHLNCDINIGDLVTDKLVAHYKFDDFQEPTTNLISDVNSLGSGYAGLAINYITDGESPTGTAQKATITIDPINSSARLAFGNASFITTDTYYFISIYIKKDPSLNNSTIQPKVYTGNNWYNLIALDNLGDNYLKNYYRRFGIYALTGINSGGPNPGFGAFGYSTPQIGDIIYFAAPQVEAKTYSTPFTATSRGATLKDYSGNNQTTSLELSSTPTWVNTGYNGGGAYRFNGSTNYITLPNDIVTNSNIRTNGVTYSAWIKPASLISQRIFGQQISNGYSDYSSGGLGISGTGTAQMTAYSDAGPAAYLHAIGTTSLAINNWYNIVGTFDSSTNELKIYVNGELDGPSVLVGVYSRIGSNTSNRIGNKDNSTTLPYNGIIDDIRIYNRTLSASEIKNIYISEKTRPE